MHWLPEEKGSGETYKQTKSSHSPCLQWSFKPEDVTWNTLESHNLGVHIKDVSPRKLLFTQLEFTGERLNEDTVRRWEEDLTITQSTSTLILDTQPPELQDNK
ncbi:unnamed protein product [Rangifer tarandus platyrhynchus]|uniref:Uncharacterized protein n=2 Tax=Rangifer tarandus platyrhynchus TaxID=3082113 RepID=A0AC59YQU5_RANTA|nr:unnamed protein product [Rangifer tarandus platyrhynchus]